MQPHKNRRNVAQPSDDKEQSRLFLAKAREIGADENRSEADKLLGELAKLKPRPRKVTNKNE